jgi:hypothetical protein
VKLSQLVPAGEQYHVYFSLPSTTAASLVGRAQAGDPVMGKRGTILRCAYTDCKRTTDKRSFGRLRTLTDDQLSSYSTWLKTPHDGVMCDYHYTRLSAAGSTVNYPMFGGL